MGEQTNDVGGDSTNEKKVFTGFGTFEGVFTPTILTILGVIMYLRFGWVVGNAGLGGAILIIALAKIVTITTGLSIASMATNTKVGAGGSYALISRSLGLEIGSSVGIPLFMSQALGGAMYITGFTEAFVAVFPKVEPIVVSMTVLGVLFVVSMISAKVAMKVQYIIMAVIVLSLISFFSATPGSHEVVITGWGGFQTASFWVVFSIFFPAVTGIEAGAAMSGDLADPKKSLKTGILVAIAISMVVYICIAVWLDVLADPEALANNYTIMMDLARWKYLLIAGVFGATLSSALGSIVGGPRTLMALGQDRAIPFSKIIAKQSPNGEPRYAIVVTAILIAICLVLGDLNSIAPLLTMFFLITYGVINTAVLIEQGTGIASFRPSFKMPLAVPLVGAAWCFIVMIFINPYFAVSSICVLLLIYVIQIKRGLTTPWGDVRRALFTAIAEWAAKTSAAMPKSAKSWKPNLLVPIEDPKSWHYLLDFVRDMVRPGGTVRLISIKKNVVEIQSNKKFLMDVIMRRGVARKTDEAQEVDVTSELDVLKSAMSELADNLRNEGVFAEDMVLESSNFLEGASLTTQVMKGTFFPPNIIFLTMSADVSKDENIEKLIAIGMREKLGIIVLSHHAKASFGRRKTINVWLRLSSKNVNLALLSTMRLARNWYADIRLIAACSGKEDYDKKMMRFQKTIQYARMPTDTQSVVIEGDFASVLKAAPVADLNVFGLPHEVDMKVIHDTVENAGTSCLFVLDSGEERVWT